MKEYRIIDYSIEYQQKLKDFLKKHNPSFSDVYVDFLVENAWNDKHEDPAILVVDDDDNIVGEHLFFYTKAKINGVEQGVRWSHDTYLEESARRYIGLDFVIEINSRKNCFGIGLSEINKKITQKVNRAAFFPVYTFLLFNPYLLLDILKRPFVKTVKQLDYSDSFAVKDITFEKVTDINTLHIPNQGYWGGQDGYDIEFVRDREYIRRRFFNNPVFKYTMYHNNDSYFIVRPIIYRGFRTLSIVDYRYNMSKQDNLDILLKAFTTLAKKNHCGITCIITSEFAMLEKLKKFPWKRMRISDLLFSKKFVNKANYSVMATISDPDGEYHL